MKSLSASNSSTENFARGAPSTRMSTPCRVLSQISSFSALGRNDERRRRNHCLYPLGRDDGWNFSSLHCEKTTEGAASRPCGTAPPLVGSLNADFAAAAPRMD